MRITQFGQHHNGGYRGIATGDHSHTLHRGRTKPGKRHLDLIGTGGNLIGHKGAIRPSTHRDNLGART